MPAPTPHGVALAQYAGVDAALAEGHALEAVLAQEQVAPELWPAIDLAFKDAISADADVFSDYCQKRVEAEDHLTRRVSPLDDDLRAWMGFVAALGTSESGAFLRRHGLTNGDVGRLMRGWNRRFDEDPKLSAEATALSESPPAPPSTVTAEPAVLRPFPWTPKPAPSVARPASAPIDPLPPSDGPTYAPPPGPPAPPPVVVIPRIVRPAPVALGSTAHGAVSTGPALPFQGGRARPSTTTSTAEPQPAKGGTAAMPAMPDLRAPPGHRDPREPVPALSETAPAVPASTPAVPFVGRRSPPAPIAHTLEPVIALGETEDASGPPRRDQLELTLDPSDAPRPRALPFETPQVPRGHPAPRVTNPAGALPALPAGMKLDDFARLSVECELHPQQRPAILARWHLTSDHYDRLRASVEAFFAARPGARASWEKMVLEARRLLQGG